MTEETPETEYHHGENYPPSRPGKKTAVIAAAVLIGAALILNWASVSDFVHSQEEMHAGAPAASHVR